MPHLRMGPPGWCSRVFITKRRDKGKSGFLSLDGESRKKGDHPYADQDVCACGVPDSCWRVRGQGTRLSKRNFAADGLDDVRDAGKRIEVRGGRTAGHGCAEQE